ncbi:hypothetical protein [Rheinheimera sp. WS51]|uniref:hypothetical protein n=1 Tax=Rheinheimera sp. WS51 TaxID=3425886 RepID=UPI003D91551E
MTTLDKTKVLAEFTTAYKAAFGKEPNIEQKPGWYSVDGSKNMRLADLQELGQSYSKAGSSTTKSQAKAPKKAASQSAKKSPAAKTTKSKAQKPKTTASGNGETPDNVWQQHVVGKKQRMPRGFR